jgi:endonuclease-3 related protein
VDAYTWRIMGRIFGPSLEREISGSNYDIFASFLMDNLDGDAIFYNRFHALMVLLGKEICKKVPLCRKCPVSDFCVYHMMENKTDTCCGGNKD